MLTVEASMPALVGKIRFNPGLQQWELRFNKSLTNRDGLEQWFAPHSYRRVFGVDTMVMAVITEYLDTLARAPQMRRATVRARLAPGNIYLVQVTGCPPGTLGQIEEDLKYICQRLRPSALLAEDAIDITKIVSP